ncbi:glycosyltransferase family 2 protein [Aestuariivirga sp.]|uniref:glycosyltransferase family 2 protein n=1 Tax=Aestuariivirga sp. TaxID=2650926 RepID=UPI003784FD21
MNTAEDRETLSLVVPVLNEEQAIPIFLGRIRLLADQLGNLDMKLEVIFVDDGSRDMTVHRILSARSDGFQIRLVKLSRNFGKDSALAAGLAHATGQAIIPLDVDLQDPPELIPLMVDAWKNGAKIVNAKRKSRASDSLFKRTTSRWFYKVFNRLSDYPLREDVGDFRLFDRQVVDILNEMPERVRFMKGMFAWVGFEPVTIEYERPKRSAGNSKWKAWNLWNFALDGITGSTTLPLRAWTYVGFTIAFLALLLAARLVVNVLIYGIDVPGYASLMVVTLLLGASNLIAVGILGEYLGRVSIEVRQRPIYIVDSVTDVSNREARTEKGKPKVTA